MMDKPKYKMPDYAQKLIKTWGMLGAGRVLTAGTRPYVYGLSDLVNYPNRNWVDFKKVNNN